MLTLKVQIDEETRKDIKSCYGKNDYNTVNNVLLDILFRYFNIEYFDPKITIAEGNYKYCEFCGEKAKKNKVVDVDGKNLEEHKICQNCGSGTPQIK